MSLYSDFQAQATAPAKAAGPAPVPAKTGVVDKVLQFFHLEDSKTPVPAPAKATGSLYDQFKATPEVVPMAPGSSTPATPVVPTINIKPVVAPTFKDLAAPALPVPSSAATHEVFTPVKYGDTVSALKAIPGLALDAITSVPKSLFEAQVNPSPEELAVEAQVTSHPTTTFGKIVQAVPNAATKAVFRFFQPMFQPFADDVSAAIITPEFVDKIRRGELPLSALDVVAPALHKSSLQVIGDTTLAVLSTYMPNLLGASVGRASALSGVAALRQGATSGAVAGGVFGTAQVLSSGTTDPKEIAKIYANNIVGGAILGGIVHSAVPLAHDAFIKATKDVQRAYGLPQFVYIDASKIKAVINPGIRGDTTVVSPAELSLVKSLGMTTEQYARATREGLSIEVPASSITTLVDKPYWANLKDALGFKPSSEVIRTAPQPQFSDRILNPERQLPESTQAPIEPIAPEAVRPVAPRETPITTETPTAPVTGQEGAVLPPTRETAIVPKVGETLPITRETVPQIAITPPTTPEQASATYYEKVLKPALDSGKAVVIGADNIKDFFGNDYNLENHKMYSAAANSLYEKALEEVKNPVVHFTVGGPGSGKSDFIAKGQAESGFNGIIYDSTAWNYEGLQKQIDAAHLAGKQVEFYGILPDLVRSRAYTFIREASGQHPVTEAAFNRTHAGAIETMIKLIKDGVNVYVLDTRNITTPAQVASAAYEKNPLALLEGIKYDEQYVKESTQHVNASNSQAIVSAGKEAVSGILEKDRTIANGEVVPEDVAVNTSGNIAARGGKRTQKQTVEQAVSGEAKTIKQVAEETGIVEPSIRRILGEGAKQGVFTRVEKGVYVLSADGEDRAFIHTADAVETLPKLAADGFKSDMVFLDIPYNTKAVKGGSRGVKYDLISVDDFKKVAQALSKIVRDDQTPVYYMYSQAESGLTEMLRYNDVLIQEGFKPIARGEYTKLFKTGAPVTNVRGVPARPEGILLLNKSGVFSEKDAKRSLDFKFLRPKGYSTEKAAELLNSLILQGTSKGATILDPFAGSGVTGAEAVKLGRKAVLIEKNAVVVEQYTKPRVESALQNTFYVARIAQNFPVAYKKITGKLVDLGVPGIEQQFFISRFPDINKDGEIVSSATQWAVSEVSSGSRVGEGRTQKAAIENAQAVLKKAGPEATTAAVEKRIEQLGLSPAVKKTVSATGSRASMDKFADLQSTAVESKIETVKRIEFPELVQLAKQLIGDYPAIESPRPRPSMSGARPYGLFIPSGNGKIVLNPDIFKAGNEGQAAKTLAHELGHLIDYLPNKSLSRGNLLGRLATLNNFRKDFYAEAGASRTNTAIASELWELSKTWKPVDETASADTSYLAYRKRPEEVYADFISVIFNDPALAAEHAPETYNTFFKLLDRKPEVATAYFDLQVLLKDGETALKNRKNKAQEMFRAADMKAVERQRLAELEAEVKKKSFWFRFKYDFVDRAEAVREMVDQAKKEGRLTNEDDNPTYYLEESRYLGGKIKAVVDERFNAIYEELNKNDLTWDDLGEMLFYERILKGDRGEVANPEGLQADFVRDLYGDIGTITDTKQIPETKPNSMKAQLGAEKFAALQDMAVRYRKAIKDVFVEGHKEGLYSNDLLDLINSNDFYVPFKPIKYAGEKSRFSVKKQKGTLQPIENPANTGIEKTVAVIRAIERNKVARKTIEFVQTYFPKEIQEANTMFTGKTTIPLDPREQGMKLVTYMEGGKVKGFYVDEYIGEALIRSSVGHNNVALEGLRFMNSNLFRPLFISFNLGFQSFNFVRDFTRYWKNVPGMSVVRAISTYYGALPAAKVRAFGLPEKPTETQTQAHNLILQMEKEQVLSTTFNDILKGQEPEEQQIEKILRDLGVREQLGTKWDKIPVIREARKVLEFIEQLGNLIETLPKVAGFVELQGKMEPREMRSFVRKYVGSPDFLVGGRLKPFSNEIFLFSNAIAQGIRSDWEIAIKNPKTRSGWWWKTSAVNIVPKLLMAMAAAGLLGDELKKLLDNVSEYDKTNYAVIPLGLDQNGKTMYVRIPQDESGRLVGGLIWKGINLAEGKTDPFKDTMQILSYTGGQLPSLSPVLGAVTATSQFVSGQNPYDFFRGRNVLSDQQQAAGGMAAFKPFAMWIFEELGGGIFAKPFSNSITPAQETTATERVLAMPLVSNVFARFLRVSDYGQTEINNNVLNKVKSEAAQQSLNNADVVKKYVSQAFDKTPAERNTLANAMVEEALGHKPATPDERKQANTLKDRFNKLVLRGSVDPHIDSLIAATSNDQKAALLLQYQKTLSAADYASLKAFVIKERIASPAVFTKMKTNLQP